MSCFIRLPIWYNTVKSMRKGKGLTNEYKKYEIHQFTNHPLNTIYYGIVIRFA